MRPQKLSSNVFLELPPVLAHYIDAERHQWIEGNPKRGRLNVLNRSGSFTDLEAQAVERRHIIEMLGLERARALRYRTGFEQGRRDGARHLNAFGDNTRLALQAATVFGQLQGRYVAEEGRFEFDLDKRTLYRELTLTSSVEAVVHKMTYANSEYCGCWQTAGYIAGHVSEIVGRRVITLELQCICKGDADCRFVSRLDQEWGEECAWARTAMTIRSVEEELRERDERIAEAQKSAQRANLSLGQMQQKHRPEAMLEGVIADSEAMTSVVQKARQLAGSDATVLISGEHGTGKETLARSIHYGSARKNKPFIVVDCKGLRGPLLIQELRGYIGGVLPGVVQDHKGAFIRANGGTLYLTELLAFDPDAQGEILRILGQREVEPFGAEKPVKVDVRIIAAMDEDPIDALEAGALREDLFYSLSIGRIDLPPLRERRTDIIRLAELFLREFRERHGQPDAKMSPEFKEMLLQCAWPGNVRQLRNVIEHALIMAMGRDLSPADLPEEVLADRWQGRPKELSLEVVRAALNRARNNRTRAAELLGVGRTTLWRAMKRLDVA